MKYYDWNKTLSYDADVTMVVGARGIGKTYGLRLQFIRDFLKNGSRFVELTRHQKQLADFTSSYFSRIIENNEFPNYIFKTTTKNAYIAEKVEEGEKPKWKVCGYFGAMTAAQDMKKQTFSKVKRILLDEAIIDKRIDRYHRYLANEYSVLANIVDSVLRERPDTDNSLRPRIYLLGNACDLLNPYFSVYGVGEEPKIGYSWYGNKTMLLHYVKDEAYAIAKNEDTVAGRMLDNTIDNLVASANEFLRQSNDFVYEKPKWAKFQMGIVYQDRKYGIWVDDREGYYYVNRKIPNNTTEPVFALTANDNKVNYIAARKAETALRGFTDLYYLGIVRYETALIKTEFVEILALFGVR